MSFRSQLWLQLLSSCNIQLSHRCLPCQTKQHPIHWQPFGVVGLLAGRARGPSSTVHVSSFVRARSCSVTFHIGPHLQTQAARCIWPVWNLFSRQHGRLRRSNPERCMMQLAKAIDEDHSSRWHDCLCWPGTWGRQ